jgi:hypothetical protein
LDSCHECLNMEWGAELYHWLAFHTLLILTSSWMPLLWTRRGERLIYLTY